MHLCSAVSVTPGREGGGEAEEGGRHAGLETVLSSFQQTQPVVLSRGRVSRKAPGGEKNLWARASLPLVHMHSTGCQDPTFLAAAVCISCLGKPEAWTSVEEVSIWAGQRVSGSPTGSRPECVHRHPDRPGQLGLLESRSPSLLSSNGKAVGQEGRGLEQRNLCCDGPGPAQQEREKLCIMTLAATRWDGTQPASL